MIYLVDPRGSVEWWPRRAGIYFRLLQQYMSSSLVNLNKVHTTVSNHFGIFRFIYIVGLCCVSICVDMDLRTNNY